MASYGDEEPEEVLSELSLSDDDDDYVEVDDMLGQEERERLANMTELEREMEVALKEERLQQKRQRAQLLRKEKRREKEAAELTDGKKTPSEKRTQDAKRAALEELASRKRRQTGKGASKKRNVDDGQEEGEEESSGEEEAGDEEELYGGHGLEGDPSYGSHGSYGSYGAADDDLEGDPESASYQEAKAIQVRRHKMEDWFDKPFFKSAMNGVVVRLAVGNKQVLPGELEGRGRVSYVCAKVLGLVEREPGYYKYNHTSQSWKSPYPFGKGKTSLWLRVIRGGSEKFWPLAQVSNSSMTEQEWFHYQQGEADAGAKGGRELTRGDVERAKKRLLEAETYTYSEKDVAELLRSKKSVVKNFALEKARLERERDAALQRGEASLAEELDGDIRRLEEDSFKRRKEDKMAKVNAKNAKKNFHDGLAFREDGLDKGNDEMDPFRRRATRPMVYWKTKRDDGDVGTEEFVVDDEVGREELVDVGGAIRQLLVRSEGNKSPYNPLHNPNSNVRRRMLSRKFWDPRVDSRVRVYPSLDEWFFATSGRREHCDGRARSGGSTAKNHKQDTF